MNRIDQKFRTLKGKKKKALIAFIAAGYPSLEVTRKLVLEFSRIGVDIIELGVPFSDPMADGPIIQEASQWSLRRGTNLYDILSLVKKLRRDTDIPLCLMSYYNPIFCLGEERFIRKASASGVDGVIIPDLLPEEGRAFIKLADRAKLDTILFISPTSTQERIKFISGLSRGFIYYVSLTGVTGPRQNLSADLINKLRAIKKLTAKPVCVGFGISGVGQVKEIYKFADGVIVGSAIVKKIKDNIGRSNLVKKVSNFVASLRA